MPLLVQSGGSLGSIKFVFVSNHKNDLGAGLLGSHGRGERLGV
jgi:hypothetical protein